MAQFSDVDYRASRVRWHLDMAVAATTDIACNRHTEIARRFADYNYPTTGIEELEASIRTAS